MLKNIFSRFGIAIFLMGMVFVCIPTVSLAQNTIIGGGSNTTLGGGSNTSLGGVQQTTLSNPLNFYSICGLVKAIFNVILTLGTPIAVLFLVYAGFRFIVARGNPGELQKARTNLVHVILGIAIFLGAWILGQIIASTINSIATSAGQQSITGNTCN
jgi:hypothetical protein